MKFRFSNLNPTDWIALASPAAALLVGTLSILATGEGGVSWATMIAIALTYLTAEKIARIAFEHEVRRSFVQQKRAKEDLICVGSVADGVRWFGENREGLERVDNTVFTRGENSHIIDDATWNRHLDGIRAAIADSCVWTDIAIPDQVDNLKGFRGSLPESDRRRYLLFSLATGVPIMQCMTLRYKDGTTKILFGWDFASTACKCDYVFLGEGDQVVNYFNQYMLGLQQVSTKVDFTADSQQSTEKPVPQQPAPAPA